MLVLGGINNNYFHQSQLLCTIQHEYHGIIEILHHERLLIKK